MDKETLNITHPHIAAQWHPIKNETLQPSMITYGMRKEVWWKCNKTCNNGCIHEWLAPIRIRTINKHGCPFCSHNKICIHESIVSTRPDAIKYWNYDKNTIDPLTITAGSLRKVWWICQNTNCNYECKHEWEASIQSICNLKSGCPYCAKDNCKVCMHNSIVYTHPEIAKGWHPTKNERTPNTVSFGSSKIKFWWLCSNTCEKGCIHEYQSSVINRIKSGNGCPYCCAATRKVCVHTSLEATHPEISKEWHPTKNKPIEVSEVSFGSCKKVWWICSNNKIHVYYALISNRTQLNQGCPICKNKTESRLFNYLFLRYKDIISQFTIDQCRKKLPLRFDFYIPSKNCVIELDGQQHFKQVMQWQSPENNFVNDLYKMNKLKENGYRCIRIYQPDVFYSNDIWLDIQLIPAIENMEEKLKFISKNSELYNKYIEALKH